MNKEVTVTGMELKTMVGDSLLIASSTAGTDKSADSNFTNGINQLMREKIQPVSTINAGDSNFFYTYDANANGSKASSASDVPYINVSSNTITVNSVDYKAYVDYVFEIKALNSDSSAAKELRLTELNLLYDGAAVPNNAYRIAIFEQDLAEGGSAYNARGATADKIFATTGFDYFTDGKAVDSTSSVDTVTPTVNSAAWTKSIVGGADDYTKLTVRLWLEGEDEDCYSSEFVELTKEWTLNLRFDLTTGAGDSTTPAAVTSIGSTAKLTATASGLTATAPTTLSGETIVGYQWYTDNLGSFPDNAISGATSNTYTASAASNVYCVITTAKGTTYRTNTVDLTTG